jgi:hypothetical protein
MPHRHRNFRAATWSTPANLTTLGRYAMSGPVFAAIVGQVSYSLPARHPGEDIAVTGRQPPHPELGLQPL